MVAQLRVAELATRCRPRAARSAPASADEEWKVKVMTIAPPGEKRFNGVHLLLQGDTPDL